MASETPAVVTTGHTTDELVDQENTFPSKNAGGGARKDVANEEGSANGEVAESELEKETDDKKIDVPTVLEPSKPEENEKALGLDASVDDGLKEAESSDQTPILSHVPPSGEAMLEKPTEHGEISVAPESELKAEKDPDDTEYKMEEVNKPKEYSETSFVLGSAPECEIQSKDQSDLPDVPKPVLEMEEKQEKSTSSLTEKSLAESASLNEEPSVAEKENLLDGPKKIEKGEENTDAVEVDSKEATVGVGIMKDINNTSVTEISENILKVEDKAKEEQNIKTDESALTDATNIQHTNGLNSADEVTKDSFEGEKSSRDVEIVSEEKEMEVEKGVMPTSVETTEVREKESAYSNKNRESELEERTVEPIKTTIDKLEKAEEDNEAAPKSEGVNLVAPSNELGDRETAKEVNKHEVPAKPTHSVSNSIMSKVKKSIGKLKKAIMWRSIGKLKKAIIGKSLNLKTILSEGKDQIKVK